jgi:hypothetical protein
VNYGDDINLTVKLLHLWVWKQEVGFDVANVEAVFVVEELVSKIEMVHDIVADEVLLWNAIESQSSQVLAHVASDIEEFAASYETGKKRSVGEMLRDAC